MTIKKIRQTKISDLYMLLDHKRVSHNTKDKIHYVLNNIANNKEFNEWPN